MIIAFEGADRYGKSTLAKMLAEKKKYTYVKFPNTNYYSGKIIYQILEGKLPFEPASFQALQILNRFETFADFDPKGNYVFDRFKLSGIVYGLADNLPEDWIRKVCDFMPDPDITFVIVGKAYSKDSDIYGSDEHQEKIKELFLREAKKAGGRIEIINNEKPIESVFNEILGQLGGIA